MATTYKKLTETDEYKALTAADTAEAAAREQADTSLQEQVTANATAIAAVDLTPYAKTEDVYTKNETDAKIAAVETSGVDLTEYAKTEDMNTALALKADAADVYTKEEVDAKTTASGTFSEADATKLAGIEEGATKTTVDTALSASSTNPVQNMAVYAALAAKQDTLTAGDNITISGNTISATATGGTTYSVMKGASSTTDGESGLVPQPTAGKERYVLTGAGGFQYVGASTSTSTTDLTLNLIIGGYTVKSLKIPVATTAAGGLMSAEDKTKLDSLDADAIATAVEGGNTDYVTNIAITQAAAHPDFARFTVQKGNSTQYSFDLNNATTEVQGLMSASDKAALEGWKTVFSQHEVDNLFISSVSTTPTKDAENIYITVVQTYFADPSDKGTVKITLAAATSEKAGVMTAADKTKLDAYPAYSEIEARLAALEAAAGISSSSES